MQQERLVRFPPEGGLGDFKIADPDNWAPPWDPAYVPPIPAQGDFLVPAGKEVRLFLRFATASFVDLAPLRLLAPDAVDHLSLDSCSVPDAELQHLEHLTGLSRFYLRDTGTTDLGMASIGRMTGLKTLHLDHVFITDAGLLHVQQLTRLTDLYLASTDATSVGTQALVDALPDCEVDWQLRRPPRYPTRRPRMSIKRALPD